MGLVGRQGDLAVAGARLHGDRFQPSLDLGLKQSELVGDRYAFDPVQQRVRDGFAAVLVDDAAQ